MSLPESEQSVALARLPARQRQDVALYMVQNEARRIIFDLHTEPEQREALARLPAEKQLDIAVYGATMVEPPALMAGALSSNWKTILPQLRSRMDTETNDNILSEYMMILEFISLDQCSFAERQDILDVAGRAVSRIHPPFRELAERQLQEIMKPKKKLPPCE